ncbi:MFS general substrate transporter [Aureobasidium pullulans EXF-150]|uniref:MFS general substrate transporter n=1 Tax=Aureobasidium pullulans EXF-150 TaxID=1043002 RepID=A0A074XVS9_AURPU|nr:MFS general substrate transporter [Aureobasidium pullulans EXF-150]KEQ89688.1 MFS general substrate transporter [Aureobasidium pullulans EXF-150]
MHFRSLRELDDSEGNVRLHDGKDTAIILYPAPSPIDPNDPLRWPLWRKHVAFGSVCAFAFLSNYAIGGLAPAFYILSMQFGKSQHQTSELLLWPVLVFGLFNFLWVPLANYYGKRPIFVFCTLLLCICYIWGATAQSFESLLWSNIIGAFGGSASEAVAASMVNDLYFLHERAGKMSWYVNSISAGNTLGPLICGFVVQGLSWRWHKIIAAILVAINFLVVVFLCPETRFDRTGHGHVKPLTPSRTASDTNTLEKDVPSPDQQLIHRPSDTSDTTPLSTIPKKPWAQQLKLWSPLPKDLSLFELFLRPWPLIVYPEVIFSTLATAFALAWVVGINILNSFVLQAPPYSWSPAVNGLINIPGLLGNICGALVGGPLVDWYSDWRARKNNGVFQPESRLTLLIFPAVMVPAGCLAFGYGVQETLHWTSLFFGYGMVATGLTTIPCITMTYISDCYLPVAPDALLLINGLKNVAAFGFLYAIIPWVNKVGYAECFGEQAAIAAGILLFAIPLSIFGARMRHRTAQWRIIL